MRFLHTSDWHVGKPIKSIKRDAEYAAALAEVLDIAKRERVDCILVAGDIFDSVAPPPEAERIVFDFLRELIAEQIPAVILTALLVIGGAFWVHQQTVKELGARQQAEVAPLANQSHCVIETDRVHTHLFLDHCEGICVAIAPLRDAIVVARGGV